MEFPTVRINRWYLLSARLRMNHLKFNFDDRPYLLWLVGWRALLALIALYTVLEKPLLTVFMSLAVLGVLLVLGEAAYRSKIHYEQEKLRQQKEKEFRERRAEEARLRFEQQKQEGKRGLMSLDDDARLEAEEGAENPPPEKA